jgi:hypothetical protein
MGTRALWNIYPASVRHWINRHGGLSRKMIFLHGKALNSIVQRCSSTAWHAQAQSGSPTSHRSMSQRPVRYVAGNAASDRR